MISSRQILHLTHAFNRSLSGRPFHGELERSISISRRVNMTKLWWQNAVVYQVYPKSFQDSNDDGIGDLRGIINRLDHIKELGADVIWLNPIYKSPDIDGGYDIADYQNINPTFGNMDDFECLLKTAHQKGLKIMMDLVVNHSSSDHEWFKKVYNQQIKIISIVIIMFRETRLMVMNLIIGGHLFLVRHGHLMRSLVNIICIFLQRNRLT